VVYKGRSRTALRVHRRLTEAAQDWQRSNRDEGALYRGVRLAQAIEWREHHEAMLNEVEREFLGASLAERRKLQRQQRRRQRLLVAALFTFALLAAGAFWQKGDADRQRGEAERQKAAAQKETGLAIEAEQKAKDQASQSEYLRACDLTASGDEDRALSGFANALSLNSANRGAATRLINLLGQRSWPRLIATLQHANKVECLSAAPDGRHLFVATGKPQGGGDEMSAVHAWDLASFRLIATPQINLEDMAAPVGKLFVNATGDRIVAFRRRASAKWSRSIELFDANSGRAIARWEDNADELLDECFLSSDGRFILYSLRGEQPAVKVVSATTGRLVRSVQLDVSDSDTSVVTADSIEGTIYILDTTAVLSCRRSETTLRCGHIV
jgi:hypothetical protein